MARISEKSKRKNALDAIKSDVRALRKAMKNNSLDERLWEAIGDHYWFKVAHYPNSDMNFVIEASRGTRKGFTFKLFAVNSVETYTISIDTVELVKDSDELYLLEFEGEEGGYIYPIFSELGF